MVVGGDSEDEVPLTLGNSWVCDISEHGHDVAEPPPFAALVQVSQGRGVDALEDLARTCNTLVFPHHLAGPAVY
jgi:hypothetical protein